jgi:hypothetical protein
MYMRCYKCRQTDQELEEQLWALIYSRGWMSNRITHMLFWIPESYVSFALCIDSSLEYMPKEDYIVADDYRH